MHILHAVVGLALILGCGAARQTNEVAPYRQITTILIANEGIDMLRVYSDIGRIATIMSGRAKCVQLRNPERSFQLSFSLLGNSARRYFALTQNFIASNGWIWRIDGNLPTFSSNSIIGHYVCKPGAEGSIREIRR